jgi:hypothetical protein
MTYTPALTVIKYEPASTWSAQCYEDITEGTPICLDTSGYWRKAKTSATSCLATHIAVKDGGSTPTGEGWDTHKMLTGFKRGLVEVSTAWTNYGGVIYLANTAGQYSNNPGSISQILGTLVTGGGDIVEINIALGTSNNAE